MLAMFLNPIVFLLFQAVYQSTARPAVDLAADVDKLTQLPNQDTISAPTSVVHSSPMAPLAGPNTLHFHSKRAGDPNCRLCCQPVQASLQSKVFKCDDVFHASCVDQYIFYRSDGCPICHAPKVGTPPVRPQSSSTTHQQTTEENGKIPALKGHYDPYNLGFKHADYPDGCYSYDCYSSDDN